MSRMYCDGATEGVAGVVLRALWAALALACIAASARLSLAQDWTELGPAPVANFQYAGRISAVACHPVDPNTYFVGGADGGVWRTTDGGVSWTPLTRFEATTATGAIAIANSDPNIIYVGTGEAVYANHSRYGLGILKSSDGGSTWTHLAEADFGGRSFSSIVVDPTDADIVYASICRAGGFPEMAAAKGHPQRTGPLGVFKSTDGGVSWAPLTNGLPAQTATRLALDPANPLVLYAAIGHPFGDAVNNGIYKTVDGGASWTKLGGGLPTANVGRTSISVAPSNSNRVYALIARANDATGGGASTLGAYRSDNAGGTWLSLSLGNIQATYGWYNCVTGVSPSDPNTAFMGGVPMERTTNAGGAWSTITPPHVDMHAFAFDAAGRLVVGCDGGVYRSSNNGTSWTALNQGLGTIQFYAGLSTHPTDDTIIFGGTQDNGTNRRNSDTLNWDQVIGGDGGWTQVNQTNPLTVFGEYQGTGNLFRSLNGGNSYNLTNSGINAADRNCFLPPYVINQQMPNVMLYATHRIYRSTTSGAMWSAISADLTNGAPAAIRSLAIAPSDPNYVYVATNDGNVQRSSNGGANFTLIASGVPGWPRVTRELWVSPRDPLTVYLAVAYFGEQQIRRSFDGGQNWEAVDQNFADMPVNTVAVDERAEPPIIYVGADHGVFRSLDDGGSWQRHGQGMPHAVVIDLQLDFGRQRLLAGTQGCGAWSVAAHILGDVDGDCEVGQPDLGVVLAAWNTSRGDAGYVPEADLDNDGHIGQADLGILLAAYGTSCL